MSTPAAAFVEFRNHCLQSAGVDKQAADGGIDWSGMADQAGQFMSSHPVATGALGGAGIGALSGLFSDRSGSVLRNALIGGGLGAGLGYGYDKLQGFNNNQALLRQLQAEAPRGAENSDFVSAEQGKKPHEYDVRGGSIIPTGEQGVKGVNDVGSAQAFGLNSRGWDKTPTLKFPQGEHPILGNTQFANPEPKSHLDDKDMQTIGKMELNANKGLGAREAGTVNNEANSLLEWGQAQGLINPSFTRALQFSPEEKALSQELTKLVESYKQKAAPSADALASAEGLLGSWDATKNVGHNLAALPGEAVNSLSSGLANEAQSRATQEAIERMQQEAAKADLLQKLEAARKLNNR